jgi:hypothetical protein
VHPQPPGGGRRDETHSTGAAGLASTGQAAPEKRPHGAGHVRDPLQRPRFCVERQTDSEHRGDAGNSSGFSCRNHDTICKAIRWAYDHSFSRVGETDGPQFDAEPKSGQLMNIQHEPSALRLIC